MKRVLFLLPSLRGGGAERQAVTIAVLLKEHGYGVEFLVYFDGDFYQQLLESAGIKVNRRNCNYLERMRYVTAFIRRGDFDSVISFTPTPNFLNCFASFFSKKHKVIISERSSKVSDIESMKGKLYAFFYRKANVFVCNSNNSRQMWFNHFPGFRDKLCTVYNAVTLGNISAIYTPRLGGRINIVVAASIYRIKNPMGLVNALLLMNLEERSRIHIDWYGRKEVVSGKRDEYLKVVEAIATHQLHDSLTLHEATNDIINRMKEADGVALFSQLEGLPNAICEAMMLGKPVVMTRVSDYETIIENGLNGYLCDWDKPETIKKALVCLSSLSSEELLLMGQKSQQKAMALFGTTKILSQWISIIEK